MRIRDIQKIIQQNLELLEVESEISNNSIKLTNLINCRTSIDNLKVFDFFEPSISNLEAMEDIFLSPRDTMVISTEIYNPFIQNYNQLINKCNIILELIGKAFPEQDKNTVSFKLPDIKTISELKKVLNDIDTALNQSLSNNYFNGGTEIRNFDSGSFWIDIAIIGGPAITFFAGIIWSAAVVRKKMLEGDLLKEKHNQLKLKTETMEDLKLALTAQVNTCIEMEAKSLISQNTKIKKDDNEYLERLKLSIKKFAELIYKGAEIHPSLMAPEESKNLFPDFSNLLNITSKIKEIPENTDK